MSVSEYPEYPEYHEYPEYPEYPNYFEPSPTEHVATVLLETAINWYDLVASLTGQSSPTDTDRTKESIELKSVYIEPFDDSDCVVVDINECPPTHFSDSSELP